MRMLTFSLKELKILRKIKSPDKYLSPCAVTASVLHFRRVSEDIPDMSLCEIRHTRDLGDREKLLSIEMDDIILHTLTSFLVTCWVPLKEVIYLRKKKETIKVSSF